MRFFNLDLHIGVIGDIKQILQSLGHEVTDWTLSSHAWLVGRRPDKVDVINAGNWNSIDKTMCDAFYDRYRYELDAYDGFIVTYAPCFAMLFEKWRKPIICVAATRYEHPFTADRLAWENFNTFLRAQIDQNTLISVANNKYDAEYAELFTQRKWRVIPSICDYTSAPYTGTTPESFLFSKYVNVPPIPGVVKKEGKFRESLLLRATRKLGYPIGRRGYSWKDIASFKSIVYFPYNASIMSVFEMYTSAIPMLFPSLSFIGELNHRDPKYSVMPELSFNQIRGIPPGSVVPCGSLDPNNYADSETMMHWIAKSDFYDPENMAGLVFFNSFDELEDLLENLDVQQVHEAMMKHNVLRKQRAHSAWDEVLALIKQRS